MPVFSASDIPWQNSYSPLDKTRIIIVANSNGTVSAFNGAKTQSQYACEYYAEARGIPPANIISLPLGTGASYVNTEANLRSLILTPIADLQNSIAAQAVFMGPYTPTTITVPQAVTGVTWSAHPTNTELPGAANILASARRLLTYSDSTVATNSAGQVIPYGLRNDGISIPLNADIGTNLGVNTATAVTQYTLPNMTGSIAVNIVNSSHTGYLGHANNFCMAKGRIGLAMPGFDFPALTYAETEESVRAVIDRATYWIRRKNVQSARAKPLLVHIRAGSSYVAANSVIMAWLMRQWGINAKYYYATTPITENGCDHSVYCPTSGQYWEGYNDANINAGTVIEAPYYVQVGIRENTDTDTLVNYVTDAWKSNMDGSGILGASNGARNIILELHRGAISGCANQTHTSSALYTSMWEITYNLLRGMTWAEAVYYTANQHIFCPVGDPLWAPF
jgi:hypothetical protein